MSEKHRFFTFTDGRQFPIKKTDSGQLVVEITPADWDQLPPEQQEAIVQVDILLSREWLGGATYYQAGRGGPPTQPGGIWEV